MVTQAKTLFQTVLFFLIILGMTSVLGASSLRALEGSDSTALIANVEPPKAEARAPKIHSCYLEEILWDLVHGSSNPKEIESFLQEFSDGRFADDAKRQLKNVRITGVVVRKTGRPHAVLVVKARPHKAQTYVLDNLGASVAAANYCDQYLPVLEYFTEPKGPGPAR